MGEKVIRIAILAALVGGCTKRVNECHGDSDCTDPAYPFCDVNGEYPASGGDKNVCTITPADCPVDRCGCTPGATTCAMDELTVCNADGHSATTRSCALGCSQDGSRCLSFEPSNGLGDLLAAAGAEPDIVLPPGAHIDTGAGTITDSTGATVAVHSELVSQGSSSIRVFLARSFEMSDVDVAGPNALGLVAQGSITVKGRVAAAGRGSQAGPGARGSSASCAGTASQEEVCSSTTDAAGAGGGGNATKGAAGGNVNVPGAMGGVAVSGVVPLAGGCPGGAVKTTSGTVARGGGGGGGAVELVSLDSIVLTNTGLIDVGGGGGESSAGGGSGGIVILEAPRVQLDGATTGVTANGGAGGGCNMSGPDSTPTIMTAMGPSCGIFGAGNGGAGATDPTSGYTCTGTCLTMCGDHFGGGGGAVGQLRIATKDGTIDETGGPIVSGSLTIATLTPK